MIKRPLRNLTAAASILAGATHGAIAQTPMPQTRDRRHASARCSCRVVAPISEDTRDARRTPTLVQAAVEGRLPRGQCRADCCAEKMQHSTSQYDNLARLPSVAGNDLSKPTPAARYRARIGRRSCGDAEAGTMICRCRFIG